MEGQLFCKVVKQEDYKMEIHKNITESFLSQSQSSQTKSDEGHRSNLNQCRLNYFHAVELARQGCYADAELFLLEASYQKGLRPAVLDLRAKMFAQQHRFSEAQACWLEALSLDPGNQQYRKALDAIASNEKYAFWSRLALVTLVIAVVTIGVFVAFITGFKLRADQYNSLQKQFIEYEQTSVVSAKRLSQKVDLLEKTIADHVQNIENQLNSFASSQQHIFEFQKELVTSVDSLSQKVYVLDENTKRHIIERDGQIFAAMDKLSEKIDLSADKNTEKHEAPDRTAAKKGGLIEGLGKILFAPIDFILNLGKKG